MEEGSPWTRERMEQLIINNAEESTYLEFKAAGAFGKDGGKRQDICKDVSSFANSDGGVIIYGMIEKNHKADSLNFIDGNIFTKEWLETLINSGIQKRIAGIHIYPIRFDNDMLKTVYVVDIPVSPLAPHMVNGKYYKRFDFSSVPMEEYEVRQIYGRKENVKLEIADIIYMMKNGDSCIDDGYFEIEAIFHVINVGHSVSDQYKLRCILNGLGGNTIAYESDQNYNITELNDGASISSTISPPIYPDEEIMLLKFSIRIAFEESMSFENIKFQLTLFFQSSKVEETILPDIHFSELVFNALKNKNLDDNRKIIKEVLFPTRTVPGS